MVERKPEKEIEKYFEDELSPYPMSLFKHECMRPAKKSKLKSSLLADSTTIDDEHQVTKIADGGALLWCCKKGSGKASETIEIKETNLYVTDRNTFLSNYQNKKAFVTEN